MIHLHTVENKRECINAVSNCMFHFDVLWRQQSMYSGNLYSNRIKRQMCAKKYDTLTPGCDEQTRVKEVSNCMFHFDVLCKQQSMALGEPVIVLK